MLYAIRRIAGQAVWGIDYVSDTTKFDLIGVYGFRYTDDIREAHHFGTVDDAVEWIYLRGKASGASDMMYEPKFTIVGVEEVQPQYREVEL